MNKNYRDYSKPNKPIVEPQITEEEITEVKEPVIGVVEVKRPMIGVVVECSSLNIRSKTSINSEIIATVKAGTELLINEDESVSEWYKVCTEAGIEGFCMRKYVSVEQ